MNDMEFKDIVSIFFQIFDNIGSLWNWYIVGLIAIVGWMLSDKKHLSNPEKQFIKILITLGFILLIFFNYQSLIKNYELLDAVTIELQERLNSNPFETTQIHNQIRNLSFKDAAFFVQKIHIPIDIIMFVLIWFELISGKIQYYWGKLKNKLRVFLFKLKWRCNTKTKVDLMVVRQPRYSKEEFARRGHEIYESQVQSRVEKDNYGKIVAIDIETGAFEVADDSLTAAKQLLIRFPDAQIFGIRIGHRAVHRFGFRSPGVLP